jgi:hypothetical protein
VRTLWGHDKIYIPKTQKLPSCVDDSMILKSIHLQQHSTIFPDRAGPGISVTLGETRNSRPYKNSPGKQNDIEMMSKIRIFPDVEKLGSFSVLNES